MTGVSEFSNTKDYFQSLDDITKEKLKEFFRVKQRVLRHGSNVVLKRGRPKVSESHKKRRRAVYLEKIRQEKKDNGTYRPRGRPKKVSG
jgi:tRNA U54 and U55 pseudouridine synthase Pus10